VNYGPTGSESIAKNEMTLNTVVGVC